MVSLQLLAIAGALYGPSLPRPQPQLHHWYTPVIILRRWQSFAVRHFFAHATVPTVRDDTITVQVHYLKTKLLLALSEMIHGLGCTCLLQCAGQLTATTDVLVYGSTPGGIMAAVAAARQGARRTPPHAKNTVAGRSMAV